METLVEIAKRIGISPNPHMTERDWAVIRIAIGKELEKYETKLPEYDSYEKYCHKNPVDLFNNLYYKRKLLDRHWPKGTADKVFQIMRQRDPQNNVFVHAQIWGFQSLEETSFIHHRASNHTKDTRERLAVDIDLASPDFPDMVKKMDDFIFKYHGHFKIVNQEALNRSDTMNVYMQEDITPQIAEEFYNIVKPCLCEDNHDKLDGFEIMKGDKPIKGIKIGPTLNKDKEAYQSRKQWVDKTLARDIHETNLREKASNYLEKLIGDGSLGEKACTLQLIDLMYYCMDKGKSPFHYISYDGSFYNKQLSIPDNEDKIIKKAPVAKTKKTSLFKRLFSSKDTVFRWDNPKEWRDVLVQSADKQKIYFGHRINISNLNEEQRDQIRNGLTKNRIRYSERQATQKSEGIEVGDWTIRVSDPESIERLRSVVFRRVIGAGMKPTFMKKSDFDRQQQYIKELSEKSNSSASDNSGNKRTEQANQQALLKQKRLESNRA